MHPMHPKSNWDRNLLATLLVAIVSLLLSGFVGYTSTKDDDHQRIMKVETEQKNDHEAIQRIDANTTRITEYLLGK